MIRTFEYVEGVLKKSPVYYIDNESECIAARSSWKCSYLNKYTFPAYDRDTVIDAEYENGDVKQIISHSIKLVNPKEIVVNMITQFIPDIDEDLVREIVEMSDLRR